MDKTKHDKDKHPWKIVAHTAKWYAIWGDKCPVCGAPAVVK